MREARWAVVGALLGALLVLVVWAPALWLAAAVRLATGDRLHIVQPRGTVWNGSGQLLLSGGAFSRDASLLPARVRWQIMPHWAALQLQLQAGCCTPEPLRMTARPRWLGWQLSWGNNTSHWPAQVLAGLGAPWNTVQPQGQLVLALHGVSLEWLDGRIRMDGNVTLDALGLSSRLSTRRPIGSYRLRLVGSGSTSTPLLQLQTLEGSLRLNGQGQWNGTRWSFRGEASAVAEDEPVLGNLLNIVGRRQGNRSLIAVD